MKHFSKSILPGAAIIIALACLLLAWIGYGWAQKAVLTTPVVVGNIKDVDISSIRFDFEPNPNGQRLFNSMSVWIVQGEVVAGKFVQRDGETITIPASDFSPALITAIGTLKTNALNRYAASKGLSISIEAVKPPVTTTTSTSTTTTTLPK